MLKLTPKCGDAWICYEYWIPDSNMAPSHMNGKLLSWHTSQKGFLPSGFALANAYMHMHTVLSAMLLGAQTLHCDDISMIEVTFLVYGKVK